MNTLDDKEEGFIKLIQDNINLSERKISEINYEKSDLWRIEYYQRLIDNLMKMKESVIAKKFPRPSSGFSPGVTNIGVTRYLGEWCDDEDVIEIARKLEAFYREKY
ncbi:hypothetical protein [Nitrospirillum sp. BR 11828]|uniref:hypothetical protein n=1 Tax=Nitrospirillum sp. BR 11828 TaxID=3104325 RepID=UPI002ACA1FFD|nr:hypothetical protein [Nitrospirillum sp. BR 11828]MDZ5645693.1 hypothetical protein [Nitrospirillum sp. BR 11828]